MRTPDKASFTRGYAWWMLTEAQKREIGGHPVSIQPSPKRQPTQHGFLHRGQERDERDDGVANVLPA
jgi:hypothetical protein